ncbi:hypothetical protein BCR36DRAFT_405632 [Piromyces finnis]|uniref:Amino acid transporter transmembrane domain-containing protein n=1 Tax=Piromyces finnis TaxID=1754191 RepID=A0A1Y1V449_9FUNG|nr:hypothetical protein BCR36DRAFT_405632 [Piromyces finnis]|eukprot:ORX46691.1 hypothetical protein BCR36DRAFT_405632 [Piromyces finnis]
MNNSTEPVITITTNNNSHTNESNAKGTILSSVLGLSNTLIGTGVLSLPFTLANTGLTVGIILFILSAYITKVSLCLFIDTAKIIAPNRFDIKISTLSEMINMPRFGIFTNIVIILNGFGTATSLLIASSDFMLSLFKNLLADDYTGILINKHFWITMVIIIIIPIVFRKTLASLKFFSLFSIFSITYLTIAIIYSYFTLSHEEPSKIDIPKDTPLDSSTTDLSQILKKFMATSIIVFAYGCQQNIFPLYSELKPSLRPYISSVIYNAVFFSTVVYLIIGYCGYATFGKNVQSNILNNYDNTNTIINISRFAMAIYCTFSYSIQMHPCRDSIKKEIISFKIRHQKNDRDILDQESDEKTKLLIDQEKEQQLNYGSMVGDSPVSDASSSQNNNIQNSLYDNNEEEDEFESQLDANDADDERSCDSHQIKHINIDILDNMACPVNSNDSTINTYDNENLFIYITIGLLLSSYIFAMTCDDFGKILSLVGASCTSILTFIVPGYLYVKITRGFTYKRFEAITLIVLGVIVAVIGTIAAIKQ